jgi:plastocyanin
MKFSLALATALFLPVLVQSGSTTRTSSAPSATPTPAAPPSNSTNINVQIAPGLYIPSNFTASNGTIVTFYFPTLSELHSATQGSFDDPCVYLNDTDGAGFDSGQQSNKQFTIRITNDQEPIWFFCKVPGHCGIGMVGAINAPTTGDSTFAAYLAAAKTLGSNAPNGSFTGPVTGGVDAVATATPS